VSAPTGTGGDRTPPGGSGPGRDAAGGPAARIADLTAAELAARLQAGELTAVQAAEAALERIAATDGGLSAFLTVTAERALEQARAVDAERGRGRPLGPVAGVPLALKDVLCARGVRTTAGSRILDGYLPPYDATVVTRLREAGAVIVGKTNMDEFAMGSSTENSGFGPTRNPWDPERVPGGSSGGSAAAVAAGQAALGIGTDTGGSIRQPASLCGVVGVKPTYGLVSRYGLIAFASSLDQVGPLARTVRDAALLLEAVAGHDPLDSTSIAGPAPGLTSGLDRGVEGLRIGVVAEFLRGGVQAGVRARVDEAVTRLEKLGARLEEISLPSFEYALSAYYLIAPAECSSNLARYDGVRWGLRTEGARDVVEMMQRTRSAGFGAEVKRRVMLGTYALSAGYYDAYYGQAQKVRTLVVRDLERAWRERGLDLLVGPTSPTTAFPVGERVDDPLAMYLSDVFTVPVNLAGNAAVSVPAGLAGEDGLPVGLQLIAPVLGEATMLRAAHALEQDLGFDNRPSRVLARVESASGRGPGEGAGEEATTR
jgi:aspartyl-tRNA(Asn)/glutamyl-tRNA(Gln) amidotransferase subunit A